MDLIQKHIFRQNLEAQHLKFSPVALQHINLKGKYEFSKNLGLLDMDGILAFLDKALKDVLFDKKFLLVS